MSITLFGVPISDHLEEFCALQEAVEVLEDMYAQRDAETDRWYGRWAEQFDDHARTMAALREAEAKVKELHEERERLAAQNADLRKTEAFWNGQAADYAARLKATNGESIRANRADKTIKMILDHATTRQLASEPGLEHERTPEFWRRFANPSD